MERRPTNSQIAAMLGLNKAGAGPSMAPVNVSFPTPRFVPTGSISATPKSISNSIQATIARGLQKAGVGERRAHQFANRTMAPLTDVTPVGNVTGAEEGGKQFYRGLTNGDLRQMGLGALSFGLSAAPVPNAAKQRLKAGLFGSMLKDKSGAIRAWHGSPHDFDRFEWSPRTRGTGEGAQAYGDGLYFAEKREVADQYRNILSNRSKATDDPASAAGFWLGMHNGDRDAAAKTFESIKAQNQRILDRVAQRLPVAPGAAGHALSEISAADEALAHLINGTEGKTGGRLYEVNINAEPEDFLDYDAPLARQPAAMEALKHIDLSDTLSRTRKMLEWAREGAEQPHNLATGRELLNAISGYGEKRSGDLMALQPYGIKGVQFLDQGSRGAGSGTRNFVVPDASLLSILNKY